MIKKLELFGIINFLCIITAIGILSFLGIGKTNKKFQNRNLHSFPTNEDLLNYNDKTTNDINNYVWDHLSFRSTVLSIYHSVSYTLFNDSPLPGAVIRGKGEWLFLANSVNNSDNNLDEQLITKNLEIINRISKKSNKKIQIVVSPNKASIYTDMLRPKDEEMYINTYGKDHTFLQKLANKKSSLIVQWRDFRNYREDLETNELKQFNVNSKSIRDRLKYAFPKRGRHFDYETANFQAKVIFKHLYPNLKWNNTKWNNVKKRYLLKVSEMQKRFLRLNLPEVETILSRKELLKRLEIQKTKIKYKNVYTCSNAEVKESVLIIHDSFMEHTNYFMASKYSKTTTIHWRYLDSKYKRQVLNHIKKHNNIIFQSVEDLWYKRSLLLNQILINTIIPK